jgi:hypothetical protein
MNKKFRGLIVVLIIFLGVMTYSIIQVKSVGSNLQYVVEAPDLQQTDIAASSDSESGSTTSYPNQALKEWKESLDDSAETLSQGVSAWTMGGVIQSTTITDTKGETSSDARIDLLGENAFTVHPRYLLYGRTFYDEELKNGDKVVMLDEQLALKLYSVADPIDRTVMINNEEYRIVGIVRHTKQVGDYMDMGAYIPLMSLMSQNVKPTAIVVEATPISGAGANVTFTNAMKEWKSGGTVIDLGKETMAATLWLRFLIFLAGFVVTLRVIKRLNQEVTIYHKKYHASLQNVYAIHLMPQLVGHIVLYAIGYALCAGALALLINYLITPVYTFTEWVPTVLVEWDDITTAFWNVWQTSATTIEFRTPELLRLRFFTVVLQACTACVGLIVALIYGKNRSQEQKLKDTLTTLYQEHVAVSFVRTEKPVLFAAMGYIPCTASEEEIDCGEKKKKLRKTTAMIRIVDAKEVLRLMPNTEREGSFVLRITDASIKQNNETYCVTCNAEGKKVTEIDRDYDLSLPVETLARLVYGSENFQDYLESHADYDLKMRSHTMEGFFAHHMKIEGRA